MEALRRKFPGKPRSWLKRALERLGDVSEEGGYYVVRGRPELGDRYPAYHVWWSESERRWICTCYLTEWGTRRARGVCTHVAAVILYREHKGALRRAGKVYLATGVVKCRERPRAQGEALVRQIPGRTLLDYAEPQWKIAVISGQDSAEVECGGRRIVLKGVEMDYAQARALAEEFLGS